MQTRYETVGTVRPVKAATAAEFFEQSKDSDEPMDDGTFALLSDSGSDGIAIVGSPAELYGWLDQARAELTRKTESARIVEGTGGFVHAWLRSGDVLHSGGNVPAGTVGMRLAGDYEMWGLPAELAELGDRMASRWPSPRVDAVTKVAEVFDSIMPGEGTGFTAFTCTKADSIARMLALFGHRDSAVNVVLGHSLDDDCGDDHGYIAALESPPGDGSAGYEAAEVYVQRMMGDHLAQPVDQQQKTAEVETLLGRVRQLRQELGTSLTDLDREDAAVRALS